MRTTTSSAHGRSCSNERPLDLLARTAASRLWRLWAVDLKVELGVRSTVLSHPKKQTWGDWFMSHLLLYPSHLSSVNLLIIRFWKKRVNPSECHPVMRTTLLMLITSYHQQSKLSWATKLRRCLRLHALVEALNNKQPPAKIGPWNNMRPRDLQSFLEHRDQSSPVYKCMCSFLISHLPNSILAIVWSRARAKGRNSSGMERSLRGLTWGYGTPSKEKYRKWSPCLLLCLYCPLTLSSIDYIL